MSGPFGSSQWMYSTGGGFYPYEIEQSLRFNDDDSAYLSRTPASAGNRKTWTWSGWVKRGNLGTSRILGYHADSNNYFAFTFSSGDALFVQQRNGDGSTGFSATSSAVYRDPSAWYHVVLAVDTTQATNSNGVKIWVNGVQQSLSFGAYNQNADTYWNAALSHRIGEFNGSYLDGYMAEVNFIDGLALDPTSFGEFKSGIWVPKAYTGSYGTNGFYLPFSDSAAIGDDLSGNGNDWTPSGLASTDVMLDSPTNNYAVLNSVSIGSDATLSDGNLRIAYGSGSTIRSTMATVGMSSGKWYWECEITASSLANTAAMLGITNTPSASDVAEYPGFSTNGWGYYGGNGFKYNAGSGSAYGAAYGVGDVIGVSFDADAGELVFYKNGVSQGVAFTGLASGVYFPAVGDGSATNTFAALFNFGQSPFAYTPPSGYLALCTANLPAPAIDPAQDDVPADYFNTVLYTGDGVSPRSITGVGFQPDLNWIKARSAGYDAMIADGVRGAGKSLTPSSTGVEVTNNANGYLSAFDADGFTLTQGSSSFVSVNQSGTTYVAWNWLAGNGTSSNTDGSITSTVSVNQKAGFSIATVAAQSNSGTLTVGHGLGAAPKLLIGKSRSAIGGWSVWHPALATNELLYLHSTAAKSVDGGTPPAAFSATSSTTFTVQNWNRMISSGAAGVFYAFAEVDGFSKFGSYTGNGSTNGPFVYCGFRPAFVMVKRTNTTGNWALLDAERSPHNDADDYLYANLSNAELAGTSSDVDFLGNGFKIRSTATDINASGSTYIFAAFAEAPFKYSNAR